LLQILAIHPLSVYFSSLFPNLRLSNAFSSLIPPEPTIPNNSMATASFAKPAAPVFTNAFTPSHQGRSGPSLYAAIHTRTLEGTRSSKSKPSIGISSENSVASSVLRPDRSVSTSKTLPTSNVTESIPKFEPKRESYRNAASSSADHRDDAIISGSNDSLGSAIRASFDAIAQVMYLHWRVSACVFTVVLTFSSAEAKKRGTAVTNILSIVMRQVKR
jgi:hypothetical protein